MQYTGLKDKNGKEIYEGDIVSFVYDHTGSVWTMAVDWDEKNAMFILKGNSVSLSEFDGEVIGNIYENPDLLGS
jgi:uncharacterized phage protein (TIGR01671 family)